MSKVLVTGGAGFIGSHVVDRLIRAGHEVIVLDNLSTGKIENVNKKAKFINGDIRDPNVYEQFEDIEFVFHLAALARIQPSIENPIDSNDVNLTGTLRVLEFCRQSKAKLIFSGSSSIYSGDILPTKETSPKDPKNPYALQKHICEQYIELYGKLYGLKYAILRYFNVYGERQIMEGAYSAVVGIFLNQKENGQALTITNDGSQRRDFTHVHDVAEANLQAMTWHWTGVFNIGCGKNYSINELARTISPDMEYIGDRQGEVHTTLANNSRAKAHGWKPTKDIRGWVNDLIS